MNREDPLSHRAGQAGGVHNRIRSKESFLLQIDVKLFDPTFLDEKVELYNFWVGLWSSQVSFSLAPPYVSVTEPAINPSEFES